MDFSNVKRFMDFMAKERTPGNAIQIYKNGAKVFQYASGFADIETETPLTGEEYYNIYSCSKLATVTAGIQLLEKGYFLLTDPLYEYIPEFKDMYVKTPDGELIEAKNKITMGDLFSMTAGLTYDWQEDQIEKTRKLTDGKMNIEVFAKCIAEGALAFEPGTHWRYSLCHDVLAAVIAILTGMKFRNYVQEHVFEPLEMKQSTYHLTDEISRKMASQYRFTSDPDDLKMTIVEAQKYGKGNEGSFKNVGKGNHHILGSEFDSGGAGIITTVSDYVKLTAALANYGKGLNGERILSGGSVELMRTNRLNTDTVADFDWPQMRGYGYGLGVRTMVNRPLSGSNGSLGEFGWGGAAGAYALCDPNLNLAVFYAQHCLNPREEFYQPRLRNVIYSCLDD